MEKRFEIGDIFDNLLIGLTVSFVALSLGAAFGILSGRENGALVGMLSAGVIALITSLIGGTRLQCSGPTGPMTAVTITTLQAAGAGAITVWAYGSVPIENAAQFVNIVLILSAILTALAGILRLGRFIRLIPAAVISGFMNGIAGIIIISQLNKLFGFGGQAMLKGALWQNVSIALATLIIIFALPVYLRMIAPRTARFIPGTLAAIIIMTGVCVALGLSVERTPIHSEMMGLADIGALITNALPTDWSIPLILAALPFALQITLLCYLDTLMTSLVVDRLTGEKTRQNKELMAQGLGNGAVALFGGIPGAQATIRSVLLVKEGATLRLAGVAAGALTIVQIFAFSHYVALIPQAVFIGVLFKVAYDVFDWTSLILWLRYRGRFRRLPLVGKDAPHDSADTLDDTHMAFIMGTMLVTIFWNLNVAVIGFTLLYFISRRFFRVP